MTKSFKELERAHDCTNAYHVDNLLGVYFTDGVVDFVKSFDAYWVLTLLTMNQKIRLANDIVYCSIVVDDKHIVRGYFDCDQATSNDLPLFTQKDLCKCLPKGKLNFEYNPFDKILALMSEH